MSNKIKNGESFSIEYELDMARPQSFRYVWNVVTQEWDKTPIDDETNMYICCPYIPDNCDE